MVVFLGSKGWCFKRKRLERISVVFSLYWEISQFVVTNERLVFNFVFSRDSHSYIRNLRVESFIHSYFTRRVVFIPNTLNVI